MEEVNNILNVLRETKKLMKEGDSREIKFISNRTIQSAAISQDPDDIIIAVLIYSLGKITEREHYRQMPGWENFYKTVEKNLNFAIKDLEKNKLEHARLHLGKIRDSIGKIDSNLSVYIQDVFRKAEINKAFKLYEHGLSSEQTAKLLGVSLWDLSSYIGQSSIGEASASISMPVKKRIKIAEELFE